MNYGAAGASVVGSRRHHPSNVEDLATHLRKVDIKGDMVGKLLQLTLILRMGAILSIATVTYINC